MSDFLTNQPMIENCGSDEDKAIKGNASGLQMEEEMCPRLFGVSIGAKRRRRCTIEQQQDDEMQQE